MLIIEVIWPKTTTWRSIKRYIISKTSTTFPKKTLGVRVETNIRRNSKAIIMLALRPGRCFLHHKGIENDQRWFFHVTAGNIKFAVINRQFLIHSIFLHVTRVYRGNAILEILYSRLKKIVRDSRILVDKKASDFVLSWTFVQKLLLVGMVLVSSHLFFSIAYSWSSAVHLKSTCHVGYVLRLGLLFWKLRCH